MNNTQDEVSPQEIANNAEDNTKESIAESELELTRNNILNYGIKLKLFDSDEENNLNLYCYIKCGDDDSDFVKKCKGIVFNGDDLVLKTFPYSIDYNVNDPDSFSHLIPQNLGDIDIYDSHEGTLIRVFNFNGKWFVCTHRKLNAFRSKWSSRVTFGDMFKDALENLYNNDLNFKNFSGETGNVWETFLSNLNKDYKYLFLVRNNYENRIVCNPPENPTVYHVGTYTENDNFVFTEDVGIPYPRKHNFDRISDLIDYVEQVSFNNMQGVIVFPNHLGKNDENNFKVMNSDYSKFFKARGNEASIKFRYLQVRMDREMTDMLYYLYPKFADNFDDYENTLYDIAKKINYNYIQRFIKKKYVTVPQEEYRVMRECHGWHLEDREKNRISLSKIMDVLNIQYPTSLNKMIKRFKTEQFEKKSESNNYSNPRSRSPSTFKDKPTFAETVGSGNMDTGT